MALFQRHPLAIATSIAVALLAATAANANQSLNSAGYAGTIGGVGSLGTVHSSQTNPASTSALIHPDEKLRFGYLSNISFYAELGESKDFDKKIDNLMDRIDRIDDINDNGEKAQLYDDIVSDANNVLIRDLNKGAQIRAGASVNAPLTPFLFRSDKAQGTFSFNIGADAQVKAGALMSPFALRTKIKVGGNSVGNIDIDPADILGHVENIENLIDGYEGGAGDLDTLLDGIAAELNLDPAIVDEIKNNPNYDGTSTDAEVETTVKTDSALDIKAAKVIKLAFGYDTDLSDWLNLDTTHGQLGAGARLNYYNVELGRNFVSFQSEIDGDDDDDDFSDRLTDDFFDNTSKKSQIGIDIGAMWKSTNYQAGATIYNLNEPKFQYPDLSRFIADEDMQSLRALKQNAKETVKLGRHMVVEGSWFTENRKLALNGYYTIGRATNFVGDASRKMGVSAEFYPASSWIPAARVGYNKNLVGTKLSVINAGFTFFGVFNLDAAMSTQSSSFDGNSIPRYAAISLGFEERF